METANTPNEDRRLHPNQIVIPGFLLGVVMIVLGLLWVGLLRARNVLEEWYPRVDYALEIGIGVGVGVLGIALVWISKRPCARYAPPARKTHPDDPL